MISIENREGYKETKLGWIPEKWEIVPLGLLFSFKNGINADKSAYGIGTRFINVGEIFNSRRIYFKDIKGKVSVDEKNLVKNTVSYGDILFNRTSEVIEELGLTSVYLSKELVTFGGFVIRGKPINCKLDVNYRVYCFSSNHIRRSIILKGQGVVRSNIGQKDLAKVNIPLPSIPEQKKIARILLTWDEAIDKLGALIDAKKEQKKGLMQRLVKGKVRFKGSKGVWKKMKLGEIFKERKETGFKSLELLSIGSKGVYPQSQSNKKDTSNNNKDKYKRICEGDIGYNTMRMWQGRSAVSSLEGIVSPAYTIVTPIDGHDVNFYGYLFKAPDLIHRFWRYSQGLVGDTLNCKYKSFSKVKVLVPPSIHEQRQIAAILDQISAEIELIEKKREFYELEKKGLMQLLLNGKRRVKFN